MRTLLLAAGAAALALAGCGGGGPRTSSTTTPRLPHSLAQTWAQQADAIAAAAAAGDGCSAQRLASALRDDVIGAEGRIPARLRTTLVSSVNDLADRIACTPPVQTVTAPPAQPEDHPKPGPKPKPPGHDRGPGHGHGHGHGHGGDG
ncbi:MAG TPA: hypothetical protein VFJ91_02350 [Gaiellaceae bacterium]|nr:hypothetical protein [Gaiellaceae bacterium]